MSKLYGLLESKLIYVDSYSIEWKAYVVAIKDNGITIDALDHEALKKVYGEHRKPHLFCLNRDIKLSKIDKVGYQDKFKYTCDAIRKGRLDGNDYDEFVYGKRLRKQGGMVPCAFE